MPSGTVTSATNAASLTHAALLETLALDEDETTGAVVGVAVGTVVAVGGGTTAMVVGTGEDGLFTIETATATGSLIAPAALYARTTNV